MKDFDGDTSGFSDDHKKLSFRSLVSHSVSIIAVVGSIAGIIALIMTLLFWFDDKFVRRDVFDVSLEKVDKKLVTIECILEQSVILTNLASRIYSLIDDIEDMEHELKVIKGELNESDPVGNLIKQKEKAVAEAKQEVTALNSRVVDAKTEIQRCKK